MGWRLVEDFGWFALSICHAKVMSYKQKVLHHAFNSEVCKDVLNIDVVYECPYIMVGNGRMYGGNLE